MTNDYKTKIKEILEDLDPVLLEICKPVLESENLWHWPAAVKKHHAYFGGLGKHTWEVLRFALDQLEHIPGADKTVAAVAAVWHDFRKLSDYLVMHVDPYKKELGEISYAPYASMIGHLTGSYCAFMQYFPKCVLDSPGDLDFSKHPYDMAWAQKVGHAMLAHHGRKEWGSPREPQTIEALAVHQADILSVMVDTNENPQLRGSTDNVREESYKAEDLTEGDIVNFVKVGPKTTKSEQAGNQGVFVRLDKNSCPIVMVGGQLEKIPLRSIQYIRPSDNANKD